MRGSRNVVIIPHRHESIFLAKSKEDALVTKNLVPGVTVYNEKRISVQSEDGTKVEYRVWNPYRSKLCAAVLCGIDDTWIKPGNRVLYLGAASGTSVSHVSDIVGPKGAVYAVEFSNRSGRDLLNMAKNRRNVIPIIEDARHPARCRMLVGMVDVIFSDVAQPDQANCIDSTLPDDKVYEQVQKLKANQFKPIEQVTMDEYQRHHACVTGGYRIPRRTLLLS